MRVKQGQIWRLGDHFLMCGDATSKEDVKKLLRGGKVDRFTINRSSL